MVVMLFLNQNQQTFRITLNIQYNYRSGIEFEKQLKQRGRYKLDCNLNVISLRLSLIKREPLIAQQKPMPLTTSSASHCSFIKKKFKLLPECTFTRLFGDRRCRR